MGEYHYVSVSEDLETRGNSLLMHPNFAVFSIGGILVMVGLTVTMHALREAGELGIAKALLILVAGWLPAGAWLRYGSRLVNGHCDDIRHSYLRMLSRTDLLYLAIEHKPCEHLYESRGILGKPILRLTTDENTFIYRLEWLVANMDTLGDRIGYKPERKDNGKWWSGPLTGLFLVAVGFGNMAFLQFLFAHDLSMLSLEFVLLTIILTALPDRIQTGIRWRLVSDILLGKVDLVGVKEENPTVDQPPTS